MLIFIFRWSVTLKPKIGPCLLNIDRLSFKWLHWHLWRLYSLDKPATLNDSVTACHRRYVGFGSGPHRVIQETEMPWLIYMQSLTSNPQWILTDGRTYPSHQVATLFYKWPLSPVSYGGNIAKCHFFHAQVSTLKYWSSQVAVKLTNLCQAFLSERALKHGSITVKHKKKAIISYDIYSF